MTITISSSGIALDGPLVAGEKVAVTVSGLALAAEDKPTLALLARFPDALLASVELAESETAGTWTGELDTATKQTALFFATARADERRDAALELVAGRASLARLTVPMANSALCPKPDGSPFASPVYIPVPGPPGTGGDPYDQNPQMDGEASAGASDEYARGDHRHPTDTSRAAASDVADIQGIIPATASKSNKLVTASDLSGKANDADVVKLTGDQTVAGDKTFSGQVSAADVVTGFSYGFPGGNYISTPAKSGNALTDAEISDSTTAIGAALAAKSDSSALATVATTGDYGDLLNKPTIPAAQIQSDWNQTNSAAVDFIKNKPTIPAAQVNADWNAASGVAQILNKPTIPDVSGKADAASIAPAFSTSSTYAVGDYCTHEGLLYKCTTAVSTAGAWDAANWTAVAVADEMGGGGSGLPYDAEVEYILAADGQYIDTGIPANTITGSSGIVQTTSGNKSMFGARDGAGSNMLYLGYYSTNVNGFRVSYGSSTDGNKVSSSHLSGFVSLGWNQSTMWYGNNSIGVSLSGSVTSRNAYLFTFNNGGTPITGETTTMAIRSFQIFGANGEALRDYIAVRKNGVGYLYDRVSGALFRNVGTGAFTIGQDLNNVRYSFASPTPSVSGTSATVACEDRAINDFTVATGVTGLTITPPAAVTGRARDFFCRVTLTDSSLPTVTLSGGTIDIGASEVAGMTQGVNLLMFTEIASGHWLASRRSAS